MAHGSHMSITTIKTEAPNFGTDTLRTVKFTRWLHFHLCSCVIFHFSNVSEYLRPVLSNDTAPYGRYINKRLILLTQCVLCASYDNRNITDYFPKEH